MKYVPLIIAFLLSFHLYSQDHPCALAKQHLGKYFYQSTAGERSSFRQTENYDLKYHRLEWAIDPDTSFIQGVVTSYFAVKSTSLSKIYFDLTDSLKVDSVRYRNKWLTYNGPSGSVLEIDLDTVLSKGSFDSISVYYHGNPPLNGFGSFVQDLHNGIPVIWTLSEPYGALDWWPCKQSLNDKIDSIDVYVTTLPVYKAASNGILVSTTPKDGFVTYHWKHRYPIAAYLIAIAVTTYSEFTDYAHYQDDSFSILNYVYPEDSAAYRVGMSQTVPIMELFMDRFGPYPFMKEKYGHAQFNWGGGMEHQTMSFMGGYSESLIAHELAHQWFGDKITCQSWSDIWMNEGFATYSEGLFRENLLSANAFYNWRKTLVSNITLLPGGSVYISGLDTLSVSRVFNGRLTYRKAAMVLHMLRRLLSDSVFFDVIREYADAQDFSFAYVSTEGFKNFVEQETGYDLTAFFDSWIYGEGYPTYSLIWSQIGPMVSVNLSQSSSYAGTEWFYASVPVTFRGEGQDLVKDFLVSENLSIHIKVPFKVDTVIIDEQCHVISGDNSAQNVSPDITKESGLWVFPNPLGADQDLHMNLLSDLVTNSLSIYDQTGRLVKQIQFSETNDADYEFDVKIHDLRSGVYIIKLNTNIGVLTDRFVKL